MKIEIETDDFLGDENTVRDEVVNRITDSLLSKSSKLIQETIEEALTKIIVKQLGDIVKMHLDTEFTEINSYGKVSKPTTVRNKIASILQKECVFKNTSYSSDQTAFTKAIKQTIETEVQKFKKEYTSLVNAKLLQECLDEAVKTLKKAFNIKRVK